MPFQPLLDFKQSLLSDPRQSNQEQRDFEISIMDNQNINNLIADFYECTIVQQREPFTGIPQFFLRSQQMRTKKSQMLINREVRFNLTELGTAIFGARPFQLSQEQRDSRIEWFEQFLKRLITLNFKKVEIYFNDFINPSNDNAISYKELILKISSAIINTIKGNGNESGKVYFQYNNQLRNNTTFNPKIFPYIIQERRKLPIIFEITEIRDKGTKDEIQEAINDLDPNIDPALIAINRVDTTSENFNNCDYLTNQEFLDKLGIVIISANIDLEKLAQLIENNKNLRFLSYGANPCINRSLLESLKHSKVQELKINSHLQSQDILVILLKMDQHLKTFSFNTTKSKIFQSDFFAALQDIIANNIVLQTMNITIIMEPTQDQNPAKLKLSSLVLLSNLVRKELKKSQFFINEKLREFKVNIFTENQLMEQTNSQFNFNNSAEFLSQNYPEIKEEIEQKAKIIARKIIAQENVKKTKLKDENIAKIEQRMREEIDNFQKSRGGFWRFSHRSSKKAGGK